eukprot:4730700-Pleurochrysis_carterae.AAC.1
MVKSAKAQEQGDEKVSTRRDDVHSVCDLNLYEGDVEMCGTSKTLQIATVCETVGKTVVSFGYWCVISAKELRRDARELRRAHKREDLRRDAPQVEVLQEGNGAVGKCVQPTLQRTE